MLKCIAAVDENFGIGKNGNIPWDFPRDLQFFKFMTTGHKVLMGRKTFENIGVPLPKRETYVLSNDKSGVKSKDPLLKFVDLKTFFHVDYNVFETTYVCGGQSVYEQTLSNTDEIVLTEVSGDYDCDKFFPEFQTNFEKIAEFDLSDELQVQKWIRS